MGQSTVWPRTQARCHKKDRYGRDVCKVMRESMDVNFELVRAEMAWWYREYANEQTPEDRARYAAAEYDARTDRGGLFRTCSTNGVH